VRFARRIIGLRIRETQGKQYLVADQLTIFRFVEFRSSGLRGQERKKGSSAPMGIMPRHTRTGGEPHISADRRYADFVERRQREVRRIYLLRGWVNSGPPSAGAPCL
jgi:predicted ABC-class ATPase